MPDNRFYAIDIADLFYDWLERYGLEIPCDDDEEEKARQRQQAPIHGIEFWNLVDDVERILNAKDK